MQYSAAGMALVALDGRWLEVNDAVVEITGYSRDELLAMNFQAVTHPDDLEADLEQVRALLDRKIATYQKEKRYLHKTGQIVWVLLSVSMVWKADGTPGYFISQIQDITERKRTETELSELNASLEQRVAERTRQVEEASRAKSDFLANMSHELRTPLNAIIGFSELLKDGVIGDLDQKQRGYVTDIFEAGTHLLSLINDILDLSKVEAGAMQLEAKPVDVPALLEVCTQMVKEKAFARRIRLESNLGPGLGAMTADERKLKQILYNLLSNAIKFTPDGGAVTLQAGRCARSEVAPDPTMPARMLPLPPGGEQEYLAISVKDTGPGMSEEDLQKLFEPFTQVDSSLARRHSGTGLGLALVRRLAELHGGTVGVASSPGVGSTFCVWLPILAPAPQGMPPREQAEAPSPVASVPLALVVEDDDRAAELIMAQLQTEGFETMRAATAEEGMVRAAKRRPQLITLDIFLPAMDGWAFMDQLKGDPRIADTPVLIITASQDRVRALAAGAQGVLTKPFTSTELLAEARRALQKRPKD